MSASSADALGLLRTYGSLGLAPVAIVAGGKAPATRWRGDDEPDLESVGDLLRDDPSLNLGIITGRASGGLLVIDVDRHGADGAAFMREFEAEHGRLPATLAVDTPSGGIHLYFRWRRGETPRNSVNAEIGVDVRGEGGLVVAPPSVIAGVGRYCFHAGRGPGEVVIADADDRVEALVAAASAGGGRLRRAGGAGPVARGGRNAAVFRYACHVRARGGSDEDVLLAALTFNSTLCRPPLPESEVLTAARNASRYEPGEDLGALAARVGVPRGGGRDA